MRVGRNPTRPSLATIHESGSRSFFSCVRSLAMVAKLSETMFYGDLLFSIILGVAATTCDKPSWVSSMVIASPSRLRRP